MGADMLLYYCNAPTDSAGNVINDESVLKTVIEQRVADLTDAKLEEIKDNVDGSSFGEDDPDTDEVSLLADFREELVETALDLASLSRRDITVIKPESRFLIVAGGMSWGDYPSDGCRLVHPNARAAVTTLYNLMRWTNRNSDGWAYWPKPARAAKKLMELVEDAERNQRDPWRRDKVEVTPARLKAALSPIKAFRTRQKADFEIVEA
jgi:hypothetical protein